MTSSPVTAYNPMQDLRDTLADFPEEIRIPFYPMARAWVTNMLLEDGGAERVPIVLASMRDVGNHIKNGNTEEAMAIIASYGITPEMLAGFVPNS